MDSDGKPDDDEPTPMHSKEAKKGNNVLKKKSGKNSSNASKGAMLVKEEKSTKDSSTQYTPRPEPKKAIKKDFGVSVKPQQPVREDRKAQTVSVSCATDLTMNSKELTSIIGTNMAEAKSRKASKQSSKGAKSHLEEFQDVEIIHPSYELKGAQRNKSKRKNSSEKQKKRAKGNSYDSLKPNTKIGTSTPE